MSKVDLLAHHKNSFKPPPKMF